MAYETNFDSTSDDTQGFFCTNEPKWLRKIAAWKAAYPEEVTVVSTDELDSAMVVRIPRSWLRIAPPIKRNYTEQQRQQMSERLQAAKHRQLVTFAEAKTASTASDE